ncbi:NAPDH-dependent diflavin reductase [Malassezia sp. CBS 17886]|nr:NAPDH-dependent diflavin reductase [Malassezia sp. CBS 17886]
MYEDEGVPMADAGSMHSNSAATRAPRDASLSHPDDFSGESELTEDSGSERSAPHAPLRHDAHGAFSDDDASSLSDDASDTAATKQRRDNALDGLASLAAGAGVPAPSSPLSSVDLAPRGSALAGAEREEEERDAEEGGEGGGRSESDAGEEGGSGGGSEEGTAGGSEGESDGGLEAGSESDTGASEDDEGVSGGDTNGDGTARDHTMQETAARAVTEMEDATERQQGYGLRQNTARDAGADGHAAGEDDAHMSDDDVSMASTGSIDADATVTAQRGSHALRHAVVAAVGKRRAAATGGAPSLLMEHGDSSVPGSAATSRQGTPASFAESRDDADDGGADEAMGADDEDADDADEESGSGDEDVDVDGDRDGAGTDTPRTDGDAAGRLHGDVADQDDCAYTQRYGSPPSIATQRRQEALELLTRIEIGYAMLRDRLYVERDAELEKEHEMIQNGALSTRGARLTQGTHPELELLHSFIDTRKERRLVHLQTWLDREESLHALYARADEDAAWMNWRVRGRHSACSQQDGAADLRREMIDDASRKRRRLDRERRLLDTPQQPRQHQPFEADLVRKPPASVGNSARRQGMQYARPHHPMGPDDINNYIAYPDLRGLEEYDVWMDMDQMGRYPGYFHPGDAPVADMYPPYPGSVPMPPGAQVMAPPYGGPAPNGAYAELDRPPIGAPPPFDAPMYMEDYPGPAPLPVHMPEYEARRYAGHPQLPYGPPHVPHAGEPYGGMEPVGALHPHVHA